MSGISYVRIGMHGLPAAEMESIQWLHVGNTAIVLQTGKYRTAILTVSVVESSDDKET